MNSDSQSLDAHVEESRPNPQGIDAIVFALWKYRALSLGILGLALALYGQKLITVDRAVGSSVPWYAAGILLWLAAMVGTYRNKSLLTVPERIYDVPIDGTRSYLPRWISTGRYSLVGVALVINVASALLLRANFNSIIGGLGWVLSLVLIAAPFVREKRGTLVSVDATDDIEDQSDPRLSRKWELALVVGVIALAFFFRFYRLGDWTTGVHGDEGEAGMDAIRILEGNLTSPFLTGWFAQSNFYYWSIALTMKLFGTDLFGLRSLSAVAGTVMVIPLYLLVRMWFGVRLALIACLLLAISDVAVHFSKQQFSNIVSATCLVFGLYFLFKGLRSGRTIDFVWSGYTAMLSM